jgi:hypothetical protein
MGNSDVGFNSLMQGLWSLISRRLIQHIIVTERIPWKQHQNQTTCKRCAKTFGMGR